MPYIGNDLATQFQAFATQTITGDGSTGYTLDRAVANGKELLVYINNVKQEEGSGKAYTASGTTITFSEAVASTDSCYLVYMGSAQQTVTAPAGSIVSSQFSSADLVLPKTVTIGSAGAEDTKLVFDGNAQDFHIGLDDSEDKLTIGLGSTLGTTAHMTFDSTGAILKPLQPAFLVKKGSSANTDMAPGSNVDITFATETFDQNGDISSGVFTAPVTGRYHLGFNIRHESPNSSCAFHYFGIETSNFEYIQLQDQPVTASSDYHGFNFSILADMDINDTAKVFYYQSGGNSTSDVTGYDAHAQFYGYLVA